MHLLAAPEISGLPENKRKFRIAPRSFTGERFEHALVRMGNGTTQPMHYRGSGKTHAFC